VIVVTLANLINPVFRQQSLSNADERNKLCFDSSVAHGSHAQDVNCDAVRPSRRRDGQKHLLRKVSRRCTVACISASDNSPEAFPMERPMQIKA